MFYLINKPTGITSHDVIYKMRKALNMKRIGHAGTLDPLASGLMIVATGTDTKLLEYVVGLDKTYRCTAQLGATSSTYDSEGDIIETKDPIIPSSKDIKRVTQEFSGDIEQTPPQHSAVKIQGKKAYEYAREGQTIKIPSRMVSIYNIDIVDFSYPEFTIDTHVSSGTYIRSLIHDMGQRLNCGGYITALKRISIGPCQLKDAIDLSDVSENSPTISFSAIVSTFETAALTNDAYLKIKMGQAIVANKKYTSELILGELEGKIVSVLKYDKEKDLLYPQKNL